MGDGRDPEWRLFAQSPDGLVLVGEDGRCRYANPAFCRTVELDSVEDLLFAELWPDAERSAVASWLGSGQKERYELRLKASDTSIRALELTALRELDLDGEPVSGVWVREVSRDRRIAAEVLLADRMMSVGALAAGVAHDINNPLSYVLGNLDFLGQELAELPMDEGLRTDLVEAVTEAREGAERVRVIVSDLRAFARADAGSARALDVLKVLESAVNMAFVEIRHRARLEKSLQPLPSVWANEVKLGQVFLNLLVNAVHAMREGQQERNCIRVETWGEGDWACVAVEDNGPGIPPELLGRLFDPHFTTKPVGIGTGVGLAMAHGVVHERGGRIEVTSELGKGTRFVVRLPTHLSDADESEPPAKSQACRVLVIDDDPLIATILKRALERDGHGVTIEPGGQEAIDRLKTDADFDVVFCDLLMPAVTGMDVFEWVSAQQPQLAPRMVFMSGGVFTGSVAGFLERVDNPRLDKPFEVSKVLGVVSAVGGGGRSAASTPRPA